MQVNKAQNYSIRLGPIHRRMLATLARETERKPPDVIRHLIRREFETLQSGRDGQAGATSDG